jgi:hypothetical protein
MIMKKILVAIFITAFIASTAHAQVITKQAPVKKNTTIKTTPPPPSPPPTQPSTQQPADKQAPAESTLIYSLTFVKANIRTGKDNKEYPSGVRATFGVRGSGMEYAFFVQANLKN